MNLYYVLDHPVLRQVSVDSPSELLSTLPWVIASTESMGNVIRAVHESALKAVLVVDPEHGRLLFALTVDRDVALQCAKKKKARKKMEKLFEECEGECSLQYPTCEHLVAIPRALGGCSCSCLDDVMEEEAGVWYETF